MQHKISEIKLKNGAKGLLVNIPQATVMSYQINFRAGEYLVDRSIWETPHIMEHMMLGANKTIPKARLFQAEFEKNGAYYNASTGVHDIIYESECADFEWQRIMEWLLVAITQPLFLKEEFEAETGNVREELTGRANNHFRHLSLALRGAYGFVSATDQERLKLMDNVKLKDIVEHYQATHTTSNMRFVIAGKITQTRRNQIKEMLSKMDLPKGSGRKDIPAELPHTLKKPLKIRNRTVDNYYFYFDTFLRRRMDDNELTAMNLLNSMLTGTLYSRILGTARERGLVYSMSSGVAHEVANTNWWFGAQVSSKNAPKLFDIMVGELQDIFGGGLTKEEIDAAKQRTLGSYQRSYQTVTALNQYYANQFFFDDSHVPYDQLADMVKSATKTQITQGAKDLFSENIWGLGVLGNPAKGEVEALTEKLNSLWEE